MHCKIKIIVRRLIWLAISVLTFYELKVGANGEPGFLYDLLRISADESDRYMTILDVSMLFSPIMLLASLLLSCKTYRVEGHQITVYAGYFHHRLWIDGELCDEHNTLFFYTPIWLSTTTEEGTALEAKISLTNRIALKAHDRLVRK